MCVKALAGRDKERERGGKTNLIYSNSDNNNANKVKNIYIYGGRTTDK